MKMEIMFPGGKRVDALFDGFTVQTDQPVSSGGEDSAPAPFDLFLASIGTCAGIYVLSFCQQRSIPTDDIRLVQNIGRNPETGILEIGIDIAVPSGFPEKYRGALIRSAELCAVKKHITDQLVSFSIETSMEE
jgi:ribosomal protein S12 methylthiotransferase accessory factor